jgi:hypothetical protein
MKFLIPLAFFICAFLSYGEDAKQLMAIGFIWLVYAEVTERKI